MAVNTYPAFTPDQSASAAFGVTSSSIALPGASVSTDGLVLVVNIGSWPIFFALGGSAVAAVISAAGAAANGTPVMPGQSLFFARGSATYIAGIIAGGNGGFGLASITTGN